MVRFPPSSQRCQRSFAVVLAGLMVLVAACGSKTDADDVPAATLDRGDPPTTIAEASATSTTEAELTVEEEVEEAYLEANRVFFSLMEDPEQPLDELRATRSGEAFDFIADAVDERKASGKRSTYPNGYPEAAILSVTIDGDSAELTVCETNDAVVRDAGGTVVDDDIVTRRYTVELMASGDGWRVVNEFEDDKYEGRQQCDG